MIALVQPALDVIANHQWLAVVAGFVVAGSEALPLIGLLIPGTVILVGLGGFVGLGALPFWPLFFAVAFGAIAGDALSFHLGRKYGPQLGRIWPFSRYPGLVAAGQRYFARHGGKSNVIGRFVPGIKTVVPGIAGMMGMPASRFAILNVLSAFAWSAAHLFPSVLAGMAIVELAGVSKRLAVLRINEMTMITEEIVEASARTLVFGSTN
ncbi:MAG: DedA family protein [Parvibaculum sp.]